jgi:tRNA A37 threonylcarbamoyladenosine synthetase subunit TsaC/SUA5/YrdC
MTKPLFTQELLKEIQEENAENWQKFWEGNYTVILNGKGKGSIEYKEGKK